MKPKKSFYNAGETLALISEGTLQYICNWKNSKKNEK